ncbi:hypothetical protein PLESTF_000013800 [Pleodorina starrii]|nr:hypothetical protein PLESTF_000013800 [Pleodorina starrii]
MAAYALRKERQLEAAKQARSPSARFNFLSVQEVEEEDAAAKRRRVGGAAGPSSAVGSPTAAAAHPASPDFQEVRRKKPASRRASLAAAAADNDPPPPAPSGAMTKFGCQMSIYLWRKENNRCLACGAKTHGVSACSNPAWLRRKAENDAAAAAVGGSGDGKAKGKRGNNRDKGN